MAHTEARHATSKTAGKRKRSSSAAFDTTSTPSLAPELPPNVINPFSHPPAKLAQFSLAGLSDAEEDPTVAVKDFPHRGFGHGGNATAAGVAAMESEFETDLDELVSETDAEGNVTDTEQSQTAVRSSRPPDPQRRHLDVLVAAIEQFLSQGNVEKAAKAYGLALQLRPRHMPADVRRDNLWAIGAEIIMREGEASQQGQQQAEPRQRPDDAQGAAGEPSSATGEFQIPRRWGSAANMKKLRAYFETLIRQHPFDWRYPKFVSALDFNIALYSCEIYNAYCEHAASLAKFDAGLEPDDGDEYAEEDDQLMTMGMDTIDDDEEGGSFQTRGQAKLPVDRRDALRKQALASMTSIATRMDNLMREMPYSKNSQILRLRAAASLYLVDLLMPTPGMPAHEEQDARMRSGEERQKALRALHKVIQTGGTLDRSSLSLLESEGEMHEPIESHLYSTLPIREG